MNFNHQEYVEIYSALKEGCWINHDVKEELVQRLEQYMIRVAMHNDFHPKKKEAKKMTQADLDYMMSMLSDRKKHIDKTHFITLSLGKELESINRCLKFLDRQQEDI